MDQGYKHFSHLHNLIMHQMPEGIDVSCSGCHSSATGTVYVCWQCNFFLHDQCYRATRSLKHPSHPPHPLTLVPYPTYQSNSFYCNSCEIIGTGFSYSCADCEFDLHVRCAYSTSGATSLKNAHLFQELVPQGWKIGAPNSVSGAQYHSMSHDPSMPHNLASVSIPMGSQNPLPNAPYSSVDQTGPSVSITNSYPPNMFPSSQDPSMTQGGPSVSIPTSSQDWIASAQHPSMDQTRPFSAPNQFFSNQDPSMPQGGPSVSIPTSSQDWIASAQHPSTDQTRPFSAPNQFTSIEVHSMPQNGPSVSIPMSSQDLIASVQHPSMDQTRPFSAPNQFTSIEDPSMPQNGPSVSIPTSSQDLIASAQHPSMDQTRPSFSAHHPPNQFTSIEDPSMPQNGPSVFIPTGTEYHSIPQTGPPVSIPTNYPLNSIPYSQDHSTPQTSRPSVSIPTNSHNSSAQNPSMGQTRPSVSIPTNPSDSIPSSHDPSRLQTGFKDQKTKHFSHPHNLSRVDLQEDEENEVICSGCEDALVGNGYSCVEPDCEFHLHESCFNLKTEIQHKSHPEHPLTLLPLAPYDNTDGQFSCSACFSDGTGFTYHCSICEFDLHIQCVSLPETAKRDDHEHRLKLLYACPVKKEDYTFCCDVCHEEIQKDRWGYYCEPCDYGTHLGCVDCEVCERESNQSINILDTQAQLQRLQLQMQMARQQAQFVASCGASLASLV